MFDFLRNLTKSDEEKRQERLSAYLDDNLTPQERLAFETELEADSALQASLEQQRLVKQNLSTLPRQRAPRNFTLDPALYGRPTSSTIFRLYPVMRTATALAAIFLIFLFSLEFFPPTQESSDMLAQSSIAASETSGNELSGEAAAEPEMFDAVEADSETAVQESAEEAIAEEEPVEEAVVLEEEQMEAEAAIAAESVPTEAEIEETAPPAEPEIMEEAASDLGGEGDMPRTTTESEGMSETEEDSSITTISPPLTPTQRLTQTTTLTTGEDALFSSNIPTVKNDEPYPAIDEAELPVTDDSPVQTRRLLQISLSVLFIILLAGTWFVRRQL